MQYLTLELESAPSEHSESDEEEAVMRRALAAVLDQDLIPLATPRARQTAARTLICSCGHFTCPMITRYGLPVPTFTAEIEPIQGQDERDKCALALRAESAS